MNEISDDSHKYIYKRVTHVYLRKKTKIILAFNIQKKDQKKKPYLAAKKKKQ